MLIIDHIQKSKKVSYFFIEYLYVFSIYIDEFLALSLYEALTTQIHVILVLKFLNNSLKTFFNITHVSFTVSKINNIKRFKGIKSICIFTILGKLL